MRFSELHERISDRCSSPNCIYNYRSGTDSGAPKKHVSGGGPDLPREGATLEDISQPIVEHRKYPACGYAQLHSMGSSSDAAIRCQYCSNLLLLALAASSSKCLCVGLVSARPSICPPVCLSCRSIDICRHQKAVAASLLHYDPKDEDWHRLAVIAEQEPDFRISYDNLTTALR